MTAGRTNTERRDRSGDGLKPGTRQGFFLYRQEVTSFYAEGSRRQQRVTAKSELQFVFQGLRRELGPGGEGFAFSPRGEVAFFKMAPAAIIRGIAKNWVFPAEDPGRGPSDDFVRG